jgi:hypothetical protein
MGSAQSGEDNEAGLDVSVVVIVHNMGREAPKTLYSLSTAYQRHIREDDYEIIVVDNGSTPPLDPRVIQGLSGNFRLIRIDAAMASPAQALNRGMAETRGKIIGIMIDGARLVTPGLLHFARHGAYLYDKAVVATLGWYLGFDFQSWSIRCGYDGAREDALLQSIDWPNDGYRLFEISAMDESSVDGWFRPISESNGLFLRRGLWESLRCVDENFDAPGGGLLNLDTFRRALELPDAQLVILLGEGTFHQVHGGISTNSSIDCKIANWDRWASQYARIRGQRYELPQSIRAPSYVGVLPRPMLARMIRSAIYPAPGSLDPPLGFDFDRQLWTHKSTAPADQAIAALVGLAQNEFRQGHFEAACAVARLIRRHAPDRPEPGHLLSLVAPWQPLEGSSDAQRVDYHLALAEAYRMLGERALAESNYRTALTFESDLVRAHIGLADLRMPGEHYYAWLERFYTLLSPKTVLEIGINDGASLARVRASTIAIGVDPNPTVDYPLSAETHIFPETSNEFFDRGGADAALAGNRLDVGFIDGLHLYEQALRDFIHLEAYCGPRSVILIHDTVPLDEATQSRSSNTQFHTGDVWKIVLCLKHYRPDLDIFTIATPWTGLTVVTGFNVESRVFADSYEEAVSRFVNKPFSDIESNLESELNMVANEWTIVQSRLKERGIL